VPDKGGGHVDDIHAIPLRELDGASPRGPKQTEMLFDAGYHDARDQLGNVLESAGPAPKLYSQGRF
jgi:hypothetical protein